MLFIFGSLILAGALCYAATLAGIPPVWVGVIGAVIFALGIMGAARTGHSGSSSKGESTVINKIE
jgi:hypothetical protein